jgi:hypothetical protein
MKHKVKYTQKEYREEYLDSPEWKNLRNTILGSSPNCQCCGRPATDVHHMVYRNIVDVKITDLLPVCRNCHNELHTAIKCEWISQQAKDIDDIRIKSLKINFDEEYANYKQWISQKHFLSEKEIQLIKDLQGFIMQKISALVKRNVWYDKLDSMKFAGKQILQIRKIIQTGLYRRKAGIDVKRQKFFHKYK